MLLNPYSWEQSGGIVALLAALRSKYVAFIIFSAEIGLMERNFHDFRMQVLPWQKGQNGCVHRGNWKLPKTV
jgi:hypothetical protein